MCDIQINTYGKYGVGVGSITQTGSEAGYKAVNESANVK